MKFRRQRKGEQSVNITPLIDVVFLLLIFFMVSTTFTKETHLKLELPKADGEVADLPPKVIEVVINQNGDYHLNNRPLINRKIETLMKVLTELSQGDKNIPLIITADANASHQSVVTAMDAAGRLGFVHLKITTIQTEERS